jgi:tripartite-type tricarboxylate transporter receptor subunit TctC
MIRAIACSLLVAFGVGMGTAAGLAAQGYPDRPIKLIVPFPPGGPPDVIARVIGEHMGKRLNQTVVIDNRQGAGATIGTRAVAVADPDGYTLLFASTTSLSIAPAVFKNVDYDPVKSFAPVAGVSNGPLVVVIHPAVPAKTVQELVAYAKAHPGKLNYGSGVASPPHIAWGLFTRVTGTDIVFIPYRAMASAMTDLVAGEIQIMIDGTGPLLPHIQEGTVRALAVTGKTRSPDFPQLPTMIEAGYPDYVLSFWTGIVAPAGTPADIVAKLNGAINESLKEPSVQANLAKFNVEAIRATPQEFAAFLAAETAKWGGIIRATGIKAD